MPLSAEDNYDGYDGIDITESQEQRTQWMFDMSIFYVSTKIKHDYPIGKSLRICKVNIRSVSQNTFLEFGV